MLTRMGLALFGLFCSCLAVFTLVRGYTIDKHGAMHRRDDDPTLYWAIVVSLETVSQAVWHDFSWVVFGTKAAGVIG